MAAKKRKSTMQKVIQVFVVFMLALMILSSLVVLLSAF